MVYKNVTIDWLRLNTAKRYTKLLVEVQGNWKVKEILKFSSLAQSVISKLA